MSLFQTADFWVSLSFILALLTLLFFGFKKFQHSLDNYRDKALAEFQEAMLLRKQAENLLDMAQKKHASMLQEKEEILKNAHIDSQLIYEKLNRLQEKFQKENNAYRDYLIKKINDSVKKDIQSEIMEQSMGIFANAMKHLPEDEKKDIFSKKIDAVHQILFKESQHP